MARILVVEDDDTLLQTLRYNLARDGHEVRLCRDGQRAVDEVRADPPDALVLDLMLPGLDGLEVCRALRKETRTPRVAQVPILMLTARVDEIDKVVGLEVGADDYLTKPFSMRELLARVKALVRRAEYPVAPSEAAGETLESGDLRLDIRRHAASLAGVPLALRPREFELLAYFLRHRGEVLSRDHLLRRVWSFDFAGETRTVDVHVRWLRSKIEPDPLNPTRLQTVRGVGYVFAE